jgi:exodeoxyribonuclease VII large subunit
MKFDRDLNLQTVFLRGEISNFKAHSRGHWYFTLKDENTRINAIMFSSSNRNLTFIPQDGMNVLVVGRVSVFEATGQYQIYCDEMAEDGIGNLYLAFEQLKEKLTKEGLFDPIYKKPIPKFPKRIGIVTAPTGAAIRDIMSTIKRRYPLGQTILFPALVQGDSAKDSIVEQIKKAEDYDIDVLIVGRGGGSIEDLWAFNEEIVARAIFESEIPIISAVGHEIDFTISDFVADLRAETPTGAAEVAVPDKNELDGYINNLKRQLVKSMRHEIRQKEIRLSSLKDSPVLKYPKKLFEQKEQRLDFTIDRFQKTMMKLVSTSQIRIEHQKELLKKALPQSFEKKSHDFEKQLNKLDSLSPLNIMKRGYSMTFNEESEIITSVNQLEVNDTFKVIYEDGYINANVIKKETK